MAGPLDERETPVGYPRARVEPPRRRLFSPRLPQPTLREFPKRAIDEAITGAWIFENLKEAMGVVNAGAYAAGSETGGIHEAIAKLPDGRGTVVIPKPITYSTPIVIDQKDGLHLIGAGRDRTVLTYTGTGDAMTASRCKRTVLEGFKIVGNANATGGLNLHGFWDSLVRGVDIDDFTKTGAFGLYMHRYTGWGGAYSDRFADMRIFNCYRGIYMLGESGSKINNHLFERVSALKSFQRNLTMSYAGSNTFINCDFSYAVTTNVLIGDEVAEVTFLECYGEDDGVGPLYAFYIAGAPAGTLDIRVIGGWWSTIDGGTTWTDNGGKGNWFQTTNDLWGSGTIRGNARLGLKTGISLAASATLEIGGTDGAVLLPRLTTAQRDGLTAVNGMIIYNTTNNRMEGYENGAWVDL